MRLHRTSIIIAAVLLLSSLIFADDIEEIKQLIDDGWWEDARTRLENHISQKPNDPEINYLMGKTRFLLQDYDRAEDLLDKAIKLDDSVSEYHLWLGHTKGMKAQSGGILKAPGRAKSCRKEYETAIEIDPNNVEARFSLLQYHMQAPGFAGGDKKVTYAQADTIAGLDSLRGYLCRSMLHEFVEEDYAKANAELTDAIARDSSNLDPYFWYGYFLNRRERYNEAESLCFMAWAIDSANSQVWHSLGRIYERLERYDEAIAQYEKALELDSTDMMAVYQIGKMLVLAEKDLNRAENQFKRYLDSRLKGYWPERPAACWRLAMVYDLQGKPELTKIELEKGLALNPGSTEKEMKEMLKEIKKKIKN